MKPAWEPVILARKPGPMRELGIEECRIGIGDGDGGNFRVENGQSNGCNWGSQGASSKPAISERSPAGRWPANLILDEEAGAMLDGQTGTKTSGSRVAGVRKGLGYHGADGDGGPAITGDSGGASRFFFRADYDESEVSE